jgi:hypothetical protein
LETTDEKSPVIADRAYEVGGELPFWKQRAPNDSLLGVSADN